MTLLDRLGLAAPIFQAPMAGVSTPEMAAAVSEAGALGGIAVGATDAAGARTMIAETRARTGRAFNVNLFVHATPVARPEVEAAWLAQLAPVFAEAGAEPPTTLRTIYRSFNDDDAMLAVLVETAPAVVSFHFGLPDAGRVRALKAVGSVLIASATSLDEARAAKAAGMDAVVAQGFEAGGHRGVFDPDGPDAALGAAELVRTLVADAGLPVIAAGGIMDGRGVRAMLELGAVAAQLGTAFVGCPESSADAAYRAALFGGVGETIMTRAISGRPARCLVNRFTAWGEGREGVPDYPIAYDAGKAVNAAMKAAGDGGWGAQWAGTGAAQARAMPAGELVTTLRTEAEKLPEPPKGSTDS